MNTRSAEITILLEEILKESLQAGITPDVVELTNSRSFHGVGTIQPGDNLDVYVAKTDEINSNLEKIEYYAKVFDTAAGMQMDDTDLHRNSFPDRIARLERWYRDLAYKVSSLVMMVRTGTGSLYSITEAFGSVSNVDLSQTTAYIDTEAGVARIPSDVASSVLAAETGSSNARIIGAVLNDAGVLSEVEERSANGLFLKHTTRNMDNVSMNFTVEVLSGNDEFRGGFVEFDLGFASHTKIKSITATSDFLNYEEITFLQNGKHVIIPVSITYAARYITILLEKETYEGVKIDATGVIQHQFIFEVTNLRLPNRRYKSSASVYSVDYELPDTLQYRGISHLKVSTDSTLVTGDNRIDCYLSLGSGAWTAINVGEAIPIGVVSKQRSTHPGGTTVRELPTPIFKLEGLSPEIVIESSYLWEGWGQAEVETVTFDEKYASLNWWANYKGTRAYQSIGGQGVYLGPGKAHKIYTVLRSEKDQDLTITNVGVRSQESLETNQATFTTVIFNGQTLNGKTLPNGDYEYRLSFVKGDNTLNILIGVGGEYGGFLNIGSQLSSAAVEIFVKERPATSLQAILSLDPADKAYAVYNNTILLNYIPPQGARFLQNYTLPTSSLPQTVAVRFDLLGDGTVSPLLGGYKIEFTPGSI